MNREQILLCLQDLISLLLSPNITDKSIEEKAREKHKKLENLAKALNREDKEWLDIEYNKWFIEKIEYKLTKIKKENKNGRKRNSKSSGFDQNWYEE